MNITRNYGKLKICNPFFISGELLLDGESIGDIKGRSVIILEKIENGLHNLKFSGSSGSFENKVIVKGNTDYTLHFSHEFTQIESDLRYKEISSLIMENGSFYRILEILSYNAFDINKKDDEGKTILYTACDSCHFEAVKVILETGADPDICDDFRITPLMKAVTKRQPEIVGELLKYKCDPDIKDIHNETALMKAIGDSHDNTLMTKLLLEHGASFDFVSLKSGMTPFLASIAGNSREEIPMLLVDAGCDIHKKTSEGKSALDLALKTGRYGLCKTLVSSGIVAFSHESVFSAVRSGNIDILRWVISKNNNPDIPNSNGITPLMIACNMNFIEGARLLLEKGASLNSKDFQGETPIFYAFYNTEIMSLLLEKGASLTEENLKGETPMEKMTPKEYRGTLKIMLKHILKELI